MIGMLIVIVACVASIAWGMLIMHAQEAKARAASPIVQHYLLVLRAQTAVHAAEQSAKANGFRGECLRATREAVDAAERTVEWEVGGCKL